MSIAAKCTCGLFWTYCGIGYPNTNPKFEPPKMSNKQLPADVQETLYPIKWEVKSHSHQIADTSDYDGYWEVTNGKDSLITKEDYEDIEKDLQAVVDLLNNTYANFTIDRGNEAALEAENKWLKSELEQLRQWKIEAVELQIPIIAYCHKHLEVNIGDSCTALVIAELDRLRTENATLKARPGAVWVKASERLPGWNKTVKWRRRDEERLCSAMALHYSFPVSFGDWEWLDETGAAANELQQLRQWKKEAIQVIDPIMEYAQGHKDAKLGGSCVEFVIDRCKDYDRLKGGMPKLDEPLITEEEFKAWQQSLKEDKIKPKEQIIIHNNSDAFRKWVSDKGYPFTQLEHHTGVWLPPGVTLHQFEKEWDEYEKANNPAKKEVKGE